MLSPYLFCWCLPFHFLSLFEHNDYYGHQSRFLLINNSSTIRPHLRGDSINMISTDTSSLSGGPPVSVLLEPSQSIRFPYSFLSFVEDLIKTSFISWLTLLFRQMYSLHCKQILLVLKTFFVISTCLCPLYTSCRYREANI